MIPGFELETKSDEELQGMLGSLHGKIGLINRMGAGSAALDQIRAMIALITSTLLERQQASVFQSRIKTQKSSVESDPELADKDRPNKPGVRNPATARKPVQRMIVQRSDKPTSQVQIEPTTKEPPKDT